MPDSAKPIEAISGEVAAAKALKETLGADAEDAELLADMIEGETSLFELIDAVLNLIEEDQELLDGIKARKDAIDTRKTRITERQSYRKAKIEQALTIFGEKIERPTATLYMRRSAPKLIVTDEAEIPAKYWKTEPKLDKRALLADAKAGTVPGVELSNAPETLTIRPR